MKHGAKSTKAPLTVATLKDSVKRLTVPARRSIMKALLWNQYAQTAVCVKRMAT